PGTLLLVSHDRAFLDNVVTSTFAFEGDGRVQEYVGGYEDWLRQRSGRSAPPQTIQGTQSKTPSTGPLVVSSASSVSAAVESSRRRKLSYKEQRELEALPARIESLEAEQTTLNHRISGPDFYKETPDAIREALARAD